MITQKKLTIFQADDNITRDKFRNFLEELLTYFGFSKAKCLRKIGERIFFDFDHAIDLISEFIEYIPSTHNMEIQVPNYEEVLTICKIGKLYDAYIIDVCWQNSLGEELEAGGYNLIEYLTERGIHRDVIMGYTHYTSRALKNIKRLPYSLIFLDGDDLSNSLQENLPEIFKKIAYNYFLKLEFSQREKLKTLLKKETVEEVILNFPLRFGETLFLLKDILVGYWEKESRNISNVKQITADLLSLTHRHFEFVGNWNTPEPMKPIHIIYQSHWLDHLNCNDQSRYDELDYRAFNFLLECLFVKEGYEDKFYFSMPKSHYEQDPFYEKIRTSPEFSIRVSKKLKHLSESEERDTAFRDKLIGRRVFIGWSEFFKGQEDFNIPQTLAVKGRNTHYIGTKKSIINTHLGLVFSKNKIDTSEGILMPDEERWINLYVPLLNFFFEFLKDFDEDISLEIQTKGYAPPQLNRYGILNFDFIKNIISNNTLNMNDEDLTHFSKKIQELFESKTPTNPPLALQL